MINDGMMSSFGKGVIVYWGHRWDKFKHAFGDAGKLVTHMAHM